MRKNEGSTKDQVKICVTKKIHGQWQRAENVISKWAKLRYNVM